MFEAVIGIGALNALTALLEHRGYESRYSSEPKVNCDASCDVTCRRRRFCNDCLPMLTLAKKVHDGQRSRREYRACWQS
jgi:hypothetical protein